MVRPIIFILGESGKYPRYEAAIRMAGGEVLAEACWKDAWRCDALLLPGGGDLEPWRYGEANTASRNLDPVRDQQEYVLMQQFAVLRRPILGICRGLQTINVYFGGSLLQDIPGHSTVGDIDRLHHVRTVPSLLRELYGEEGIVNSAHHQASLEPVPGFRAIQWAPDGVLEAMVHEEKPIIGLQWHPERMCLAHRREDTVDGLPIFDYFLKVIRGEAKVF